MCFQNLNVKIIGMGSGLSWSSLGPTHHTTEDISVLRAIPNLMILSPATPRQVEACVQTAYEYDGPVYIKIGMNHEAMKACEMLEQNGISVKLINVTTIKPFNENEVLDIVKQIQKIAVIEEHNIYGGLASIISETIAYNGLNARVIPIGLNDTFAGGYGTHCIKRMTLLWR